MVDMWRMHSLDDQRDALEAGDGTVELGPAPTCGRRKGSQEEGGPCRASFLAGIALPLCADRVCRMSTCAPTHPLTEPALPSTYLYSIHLGSPA